MRGKTSNKSIAPAAGFAGVVLGAAAVGAAAVAVGARCLQLARTQLGVARVKMVRVGSERIRVLQQGGVYQSATYVDEHRFEPVFSYIAAFDALFEAEDDMRATADHGIDRVLMLGGGGYSYPKHALTCHPNLRMDVVELDHAITHLAERWFFLDELESLAGDRLHLICEDARAYMTQALAEGARYDAVVNDCFSGREPVRCLATIEALCQVKVCLRPGGLYLANIVSTDEGENIEFLRDATATAAAVFSHVHIIPCVDEDLGGEDNYLLIATDGDYAFDGEVPIEREFLGAMLHDASC